MRHPKLPTKLIAAALPLVVAVVGLLALTVRTDLADARRAETGAELGGVWDPLIDALVAVDTEAATMSAGAAPSATIRRTTDQAVNALRDDIETLGAAIPAIIHWHRAGFAGARRADSSLAGGRDSLGTCPSPGADRAVGMGAAGWSGRRDHR